MHTQYEINPPQLLFLKLVAVNNILKEKIHTHVQRIHAETQRKSGKRLRIYTF